MITYAHFVFLVFEFKPNFINKSLINNVINQVTSQFCFESRLNNTPMSPNLESDEVGQINLTLNTHTN